MGASLKKLVARRDFNSIRKIIPSFVENALVLALEQYAKRQNLRVYYDRLLITVVDHKISFSV